MANQTINGNLTVTGTSTLTGNTSTGGNLTVNGASTLKGVVTVGTSGSTNTNLSVNGAAEVKGDTAIQGGMSVGNNVTINKDLYVNGWLHAARVKDIYKGTYSSESELPTEGVKDGDIAGVETTVQGVSKIYAYYCNIVDDVPTWTNSGSELSVESDAIIEELQRKYSQLNSGKVDKVWIATAGKIALLRSDGGITQQNSKSLSELANANHTHGNILNDGTIDTSSATAIGNNDKLVVLANGTTIVGRNVVFDGTTTGKALTQAGTFEDFLTSQDINGKADKVPSPTNGNLVAMDSVGNLTNSGKKASDFENVSNKVTNFSDPKDTQYPSALLVYNFTKEILGLSVNEAVRVTFHPQNNGKQQVLSSDGMKDVKLIVMDGTNYTSNEIELIGGEDYVVSFVFKDPSTIPANAFLKIENITGVHIPSFVHAIGDYAFAATSLANIECEGMTPPTLGNDVFPSLVTEVRVHKLAGSLYHAEGVWGSYTLKDMNGIPIITQ